MTFRAREAIWYSRRPVENVARTTRDIQWVEGDDESSKEPFVIVINGTGNASSHHSVRARIINQHTRLPVMLSLSRHFRLARNPSFNRSLIVI